MGTCKTTCGKKEQNYNCKDDYIHAVNNTSENTKYKHIVLVCFENRSFDQIYADVDLEYIKGIKSKTINTPEYQNALKNSIAARTKPPNASYVTIVDPDHESVDLIKEHNKQSDWFNDYIKKIKGSQYFKNCSNDEIKEEAINQLFGVFKEGSLPILHTLAKNYYIASNYHASFLGPTLPNRHFLVNGNTNGIYKGDGLSDYGFSIFNVLPKNEYKLFFSGDPSLFSNTDDIKSSEFKDMYSIDDFMSILNETSKQIKTLPQFSYLEPLFLDDKNKIMANDMHPPHHMLKGEQLVFQIYKSLRLSKYWEDTLLLIVFDENGGFWDHKEIIENPNINDEEIKHNEYFKYLGYRVPLLAISKYLGHTVDNLLYEHSSIPATLQNILPVKKKLSSKRINNVNKLENLLNDKYLRTSPHPDLDLMEQNLNSLIKDDGNFKNYNYPYEGYSSSSIFFMKLYKDICRFIE